MDFRQFDLKLVELKLKSGGEVIGTINFKANIFGFENVVPFISRQNSERLSKRFKANNPEQLIIGIPKEQINEFFEFIPFDLIDECKLIENEIHTLKIVTENKKEIQPHNIRGELRKGDKPGFISMRYKILEESKFFDVGNLPIKNGTVEVSVSVAFISYAREDENAVVDIVKRLNENGIVTWFDKNSLLPGSNWELDVEKNIETADYFLLFLSKETQEKIGYKNRELQLALKQQSYRPEGKIFIIPILLNDCDLPHNLRSLNWLKISEEDWFTKLLKVITPWYIKKDLLNLL